MTLNEITDSTPARALFPEYWSIENQARAEVKGMTDAQLDWTSPQWAWSEWSVRQNLSHTGSVFYRWMLERWGETLFPDGPSYEFRGNRADVVTGPRPPHE